MPLLKFWFSKKIYILFVGVVLAQDLRSPETGFLVLVDLIPQFCCSSLLQVKRRTFSLAVVWTPAKKIFTRCCLDTTNGGGKKRGAAQHCEDHWSGA